MQPPFPRLRAAPYPIAKGLTETERLDKFISSQLPEISRSTAKDLIRRGLVTVNGGAAKSGEEKIIPGADRVAVGGREIFYREHLYIMLNKPAGVICATRDGLSETVLELLPPELRRPGLFPAGRLDRDTVGFVLITDDGELAHRILSPKNHVEKRYYVKLKESLTSETVDIFASGIFLDGEKLQPARLEIKNQKECELVIKEGKYHQIKRMFACVGNEVIYLKRLSIAGIEIDEKLSEGECRMLTPEEENRLKSC